MAAPPYPDFDMYGTYRAASLSENHEDHSIASGDPSSVSYIPRAARSFPHADTVHTIHVKKITYPMTSRPPELWVLETNQDGLETWRSIETFQLSQDPRVIRATENQWRIHYEVHPISPSLLAEPLHPVLPHPEHSNVQFGQPVLVLPDHTYILQCVGDGLHTIILKVLLYRYNMASIPYYTSIITIATEYAYTCQTGIVGISHPEPPRSGLSNHADMSDSSI